MATAICFVGPSLPRDRLHAAFGAQGGGALDAGNGNSIVLSPPVSEGDILACLDEKPAIIAIIDGFFENVPAIWHKEIMYALSRGVHVIGASSMGALRAAELQPFGMEGLGEIFEGFAAGRWTDDDEVTVTHGPAELGYMPTSEAMVNIRYTLDAATAAGIIGAREWLLLNHTAKDLFYKQRSYGNILEAARRRGLAQDRAAALEAWLAQGRRDQKAQDAMALLRLVSHRLGSPLAPKEIPYPFEDNMIWMNARQGAGPDKRKEE
jgi:hypothetical protein